MRNAVKILIVDDDKASAQALAEIVKKLGCKPVISHRPVDALNVVRLQTVHAAIVDVLLPKITGIDLVTELRETKFGDSPVLLISGVFKDPAFAQEAIKKTKALHFLFKPYSVDELTAALTSSMESVINIEKWDVQKLLMRKLNSDRERAKAIENLEQIRGADFPLILGVLAEVGSSGHLTIVNEAGEIFGVSMVRGSVAQIDSAEAQPTAVLALINRGCLSQQDWDEIQSRGDHRISLETLVQEGLVSPHAVAEATREQILADFRSICGAKTLNINFVPGESKEAPGAQSATISDLIKVLEGAWDEIFSLEMLTSLYSGLLASPVRVLCAVEDLATYWAWPAFKDLTSLISTVEKSGELRAVFSEPGADPARLYKAVHILVIKRAIMFDDLNRAKNLNVALERYKKLHAELEGKTPDEVFAYFGATAQSSNSVIEGIFNEYARSNDPAQLGKEATLELRTLCTSCYDIVRNAKDVLTDEVKKTALMSELRAKATERQNRANEKMMAGLDLIRKGQSREALRILLEAEQMAKSSRITMARTWAELKVGVTGGKARVVELLNELEALPADDRRGPLCLFVTGLVKKALGDPAAMQLFEKALQLDPGMAEAKRELNSMQSRTVLAADRAKKSDLLTGDITGIVSNFFKRKAE